MPPQRPQAASTPVAAIGGVCALADRIDASPVLKFVVNERPMPGHNQYRMTGAFKNRIRVLDLARFIRSQGGSDDLALLVADRLWSGLGLASVVLDLNLDRGDGEKLERADVAKAWQRAKSWIRAWNEASGASSP